jgi:electron transfer flavoprotein beta subunit
MKILVAAKRVLDFNVRVRVRPDHSDVDLASLKMSMNPFDEIALEQALRLREAGQADEVVLVSIGPARAQDTIRAGLAMGADRGILIRSDEAVEPLDVAKLIAAVVREEAPALVLLGKQAIDDDSNQTGQMVAALLGYGQGTFASRLELADGVAMVTSEVDGGMQTVSLRLPAVVTADLRLNQPRYPSLPNIMKAKKKPLEEKAPADYGVDLRPRLKILRVEEPAKRKTGVRVKDVKELLDRLRHESGVI